MKKAKKLTPQQRLQRKRERMRAWNKAHPEASKRWKEQNRKRYLKYLSEYWWGPRHEELLAMKRKWNREHREQRRQYRLAVKAREATAKNSGTRRKPRKTAKK